MKTRNRFTKHSAIVVALVMFAAIWAVWGAQPGEAIALAGYPASARPGLQGEQAVRQLEQQGLYDSLQEAAAATRYDLRWENQPALGDLSPSYRAPNPAQRLDSYFAPGELHLTTLKTSRQAQTKAASRADTEAPESQEWRAMMKLVGYGYGEHLTQVGGVAVLTAKTNRIEYQRPGLPLTEWYINKAEGLEQGFTIDAPLGERSEGERLRLALALTGDLRAELVEEGQAIALKLENGEVALSYGGLYVYDANGQTLPARMKLSKSQVILEVDDEKAVYPVTVDPTFSQQKKLTASDGAADDQFGWSVAIDGDTAVVGAHLDDSYSALCNCTSADQGSAYVFVRRGSTWSLQQKLTAKGGAANDMFGWSVAISGDTAVVGSPGYGIDSNNSQGSAYVFVRSGATWNQEQNLTAGDGGTNGMFGRSVAISRDKIVVGAPKADSKGAAYIFTHNGATWSQPPQKLTAEHGNIDDYFGWSVAISEETLVVGAYKTNNKQGSAYVFMLTGSSFYEQQTLIAQDGEAGDGFGNSVAISGNTIVVGVLFDNFNPNYWQGSAYVFVGHGSSWSQQQKLTASNGASAAHFGASVAITGDTVVVGAPGDDDSQGSAYVFVHSGAIWSEQQNLIASDGAAGDYFGFSVAISGTTIVVGVPYANLRPNNNQGSAYVFVSP